jgi:hypothetical protein
MEKGHQMSSSARAVLAAAGMIGFVTSAFAAEMTGAGIRELFSDKTAYIETTTASGSGSAGQSIIFWAGDGSALYKTPSGAMMHGKWAIKDNTLCAEWKERPNTGCIRYDKMGEAITAYDVKTGELRAKILKTALGNAEKLAP